ncbi:hypothetical protein [Actinoplanes regularis]|uniref:ATP-grasp domain-containing protein n=1 Tax=Actinoplanes regularis TaxID=52697 RepID=A0A239J199_9ACTN|nr:hypothetical protein [Actinoplanes regularis]GIE91907.1 hypothetical protein Are01nite_83870 [Actinoplanes regularis]SNS99826.1 hypothetical protein SAMN06264365_13229 [Actinoplanes regularis]
MLDQVVAVLRRRLGSENVIVFCSQHEEVPAWEQLLKTAGVSSALVLAFDGPQLSPLLAHPSHREAGELVAARHALLGTLARRSPLAEMADDFDPARRAVLLVTDPLDPREVGDRHLFGAKHPSWSFVEHKSVVDTVWDVMGVDRAESVALDRPGTLLRPDGLAPTGIVASWQRLGEAPVAGGSGIRTTLTEIDDGRFRVRIMPHLTGRPCRLHGLTSADTTVVFPPLELLVPQRREGGSFLCAGAAPLSAPEQAPLTALTRRLGDQLRACLAYRGGFSVDGILTPDGFRPTDLNTRVTSALESLPATVRVAVHACALAARAGLINLPGSTLGRYVAHAFRETGELLIRAPFPDNDRVAREPVRWFGSTLISAGRTEPHGVIEVGPGARGAILTARLRHADLPEGLDCQAASIAVFEAADRLLGATYGPLKAPGGADPQQANQHRRR